jgi:hypothetical protein
MTKHLFSSLATLMVAGHLMVGGVPWTSDGDGQIVNVKYFTSKPAGLKYQWSPKNTHVCLCQGGNFCSCNYGHIVPAQ